MENRTSESRRAGKSDAGNASASGSVSRVDAGIESHPARPSDVRECPWDRVKRGYALLLAEHDILADSVKHLSAYETTWALHRLARARAKIEETLDYLTIRFEKPLYRTDSAEHPLE